MAITFTKEELVKFAEEALQANAIAMLELIKQREALKEIIADEGFFSSDLIPYAPRMQQAATYGAIVYTFAVGESPSMSS